MVNRWTVKQFHRCFTGDSPVFSPLLLVNLSKSFTVEVVKNVNRFFTGSLVMNSPPYLRRLLNGKCRPTLLLQDGNKNETHFSKKHTVKCCHLLSFCKEAWSLYFGQEMCYWADRILSGNYEHATPPIKFISCYERDSFKIQKGLSNLPLDNSFSEFHGNL